MSEPGQLLELLYAAHRDVDAMFAEIRDWVREEASNVLMATTDPAGRIRAQWVGGGPYATPVITTRRVWFAPPDRVRVEVLNDGAALLAAVRTGSAWWRWDHEDGVSAGDLAQGATLPPILDLPILTPARLLSTMWLDIKGTGVRAAREVVTATGMPRQGVNVTNRHLEFDFDLEHGTPLHIATFEAGERVTVTEVLAVDYKSPVDPAIFNFEKHENSNGLRSGVNPPRRPGRLAQATQLGERQHTRLRSLLSHRRTIWLTGLPGAGKTTIARATERLLHQLGAHCCVLDGDQLRSGLSSDLGWSRADRGEQARRAAHIATMLADSDVIPIVALVSPYREDRLRARDIHDAAGVGFLEVWVDTPPEVCAARDPKGLYAAAQALSTLPAIDPTPDGSGLTGPAAPYEAPTSPDLCVSGDRQQPHVAATQIVERLFATTPRTRS